MGRHTQAPLQPKATLGLPQGGKCFAALWQGKRRHREEEKLYYTYTRPDPNSLEHTATQSWAHAPPPVHGKAEKR